MQLRQAISSVLETTQQETDIYDRWSWVEASIGGRNLSVDSAGTRRERRQRQYKFEADKVYAMPTLIAACQQVQSNQGSHGVDGVSVERFALKQEHYLLELPQALKEGSYRPLPVKRVFIPKAGGQ